VYTFTKLHDRRIPNGHVGVGVCVGPVEFKLNSSEEFTRPASCSGRQPGLFHCYSLGESETSVFKPVYERRYGAKEVFECRPSVLYGGPV